MNLSSCLTQISSSKSNTFFNNKEPENKNVNDLMKSEKEVLKECSQPNTSLFDKLVNNLIEE